jgi:hypothetical protein
MDKKSSVTQEMATVQIIIASAGSLDFQSLDELKGLDSQGNTIPMES